MSFFWPKVLWLLVLVPLFVTAYIVLLRRRSKAAVRYVMDMKSDVPRVE